MDTLWLYSRGRLRLHPTLHRLIHRQRSLQAGRTAPGHIRLLRHAAETSAMQLKTNIVNRTFSTKYGFSTPSFPLLSERDDDGNLLPSCTVTLRLPVVNTLTQQCDTLSYTADVFLQDVDDPTVSFSTDGIEINAMKRTSHDSPSPQNSAHATTMPTANRADGYNAPSWDRTLRKWMYQN